MIETLAAAIASYFGAFVFTVHSLFDVLPRCRGRWTDWQGEPDLRVSIVIEIRGEVMEAAVVSPNHLMESVRDCMTEQGNRALDQLQADIRERRRAHSNGQNNNPGQNHKG